MRRYNFLSITALVTVVSTITAINSLGETYVNVHSEEHHNGEIRGQIQGGG
jgi:CHRD domain